MANQVRCRAQVETVGKTGAEMKALTALQARLLTIYDMCRAIDRGVEVTPFSEKTVRGGAAPAQ